MYITWWVIGKYIGWYSACEWTHTIKSRWIDFGFQWIISVLITMKIAISKWKLLPRAGNAGCGISIIS